jgi:hypothetical protein
MIKMQEAQEPGSSEPGFGPWLIAGTLVTEPYPCRCHESRFGKCSPLWCPCSGRLDPQGPDCCAVHNTPARWKEANREYEAKKARERAGQT